MLHKNGKVLHFDIEADISQRGDELSAVVTYTNSAERFNAQRIRALQSLIPELAHNVNNGLTYIRGEAMVLRRDLKIGRANMDDIEAWLIAVEPDADLRPDLTAGRGIMEEIDRGLSGVETGVDRVNDIIRNLQGIAASGGQEDDLSAVDLEDLFRVQTRQIETMLGDDISFALHIEENPWAVPGPIGALWQVIENILLNAKEAMEQSPLKTIRIEVTTQRVREVDLTERGAMERFPDAQPGEFMRIRITDTGPGIPQSKHDTIFQPFKSSKKKPALVHSSKGRGLGLWSARQIIAKRGGFIDLQSEVGAGSTFDLFLPCVEGVGPTSTAPSSPSAGAGVILTIGDEDNSPTYRSIQHSLDIHRRDFTGVGNVEEAVSFLTERQDVQAVILHLSHAELSAQEVISALRHVKADLPVLIVSPKALEIDLDPLTVQIREKFGPDSLNGDLTRLLKGSH